MLGLEIIVNFKETSAFLCRNNFIPLSDTGLFIRQFKTTAALKCKILHLTENYLFLEIISYHVPAIKFSIEQENNFYLLEKITSIAFKSVDTHKLLRCAKGTEIKLSVPHTTESIPVRTENLDLQKKITLHETNETQAKQISVRGNIEIKDLRFVLGAVEFNYFIPECKKSYQLSILNPILREEFDAVKNYFMNLLHTKKITFKGYIIVEEDEIKECKLHSDEIQKITEKLIESVRFEFVKNFYKNKIQINTEQSLFTMEDLLDNSIQQRQSVLFENENALFEHFLSITNAKHYKQLRYLSDKHLYGILKLRFILEPISFIFLLKGNNHYHLVWETLDTEEATYVWKCAKNKEELKRKLNNIEQIINIIKIQGRQIYLNDCEENFRRVMHDYSKPIEGFLRWKDELEKYLN